MTDGEQTVYALAGGEPVFRRLVDAFYARVEADDYLRPMFPEDMEEGKRWQRLFLIQLFGGPADYAAERGHPRLRMRHFPFPITQRARNHWLLHMLDSIEEVGISEPARSTMRQYFENASTHMVNLDVEPGEISE
jgi:hemoglobin